MPGIVAPLMELCKVAFSKGLLIQDAIRNFCDSREKFKTSKLTGVQKRLIPKLMGDFERIKTLLEEMTAGVIDMTREEELKAEPDCVTNWLQSRAKTFIGGE